MVDALASDRSDQPFGEAVLPRRAWGDGLVADAHGAQSVRDGSAIDAIPIADHVARRLSPRECFGDLACDPVRGRMGCDVDPDKVSAGQPNDDKGIEQVEANARNNEQVHGGEVRRVVTQEGAPSLGGRPGSLDHVLRDTGLSDFKAEFEQLAMDTGGAPQWIVIRRSSLTGSYVMETAEHREPCESRGSRTVLTLIRRISARRSASTCGRPPRERDFHCPG